MHFVNDRILQWNARSLIAVPIELSIDDHRLRHAPRVVAEVLRQIFLLATDDVTEHFVCPSHFSGYRFRIWVEQEFGAVEA